MTIVRCFAPCAVVALLVAATAALAPAVDAAAEFKNESQLVGTWKLSSAKYGGQAHEFPEGQTMLKHVTPTQFTWLTYDEGGAVTRTAGGPYVIKGEEYVETPEYGLGADFELVKGKEQKFTWKVEGNKWHHTGALSNGLTIEEVWERVEAK
jgi:hypothetical protein